MAVYAVGDIQGCCDELTSLLDKLNFDTAADVLWVVGDLVNRGPKSLETLRLIKGLGDAAVCVLGNHDLHLLALGLTDDVPGNGADLQPILQADDADELLHWLRLKPLAHFDMQLNTLMLHAGTIARWSVKDILKRAAEVEAALAGPDHRSFLAAMYGQQPDIWSDELEGMQRLRFITNCLTRARYCSADGKLDFRHKLAPGTQPADLLPWFDLPGRASADSRIVFGHWSTLGYMQTHNLLALDTGCAWGDRLTAVRLDADAPPVEISSHQPPAF
jgi:bis(5'-nucleosyl)-tetraphosphatase (symmetrical)